MAPALTNEVWLTVVTVTRNDLTGLRRTMDSLRLQASPGIEHLVVDGLSSDGSADWARAHPALEQTIVVSEADAGIYDAMNKGARLSTGSLLLFLNSGDVLVTSRLLERIRLDYASSGWRWGIAGSRMVDEHQRPVRGLPSRRYSWWRQTYLHYDVSHQAVVMERTLLQECGWFDTAYRYAADYKVITAIGRRHRPQIWPTTLVNTLAGGVSDARFVDVHREYHRIRCEHAGSLTIAADACWTMVLIAKTRLRRRARSLLLAMR